MDSSPVDIGLRSFTVVNNSAAIALNVLQLTAIVNWLVCIRVERFDIFSEHSKIRSWLDSHGWKFRTSKNAHRSRHNIRGYAVLLFFCSLVDLVCAVSNALLLPT